MRAAIFLIAAWALASCSPPAETPPSAPAAAEAQFGVSVETPAPNARATSPLIVSGVAPANWFFENQFPVRLVDATGAELAAAPATPRVSWTDPGPKQFDVTLTFTVTAETPATLVLEEDMPGEGEEPEAVRIPIVLVPAP